MSQQARDYYSYKLKFVNGESSRNRHFDQLKTYNNKLEKLLHSSDKDTHTLQQRASVAASATADQAICSFWKHANQLFNALKSAWDCCCREKYCVQVLLQHRTTKKSEFHIMFARESSGSSWLMQETRIVDGNDSEIVPARVSALQGKSAAIKQPGNHRQAIAIKSAFRIKGQKTNNTTASR